MTDLCEEFGISRQTGHRIWSRFQEKGPDALLDQSRAPKRIPHRTPQELRELVVQAKKKHPTWGPKKLYAWLSEQHRGGAVPAGSTIGEILKQEGLVKSRPRRQRFKATGTGRDVPTAPNQLWCADFKGQFRLGNGSYCYPLTITDAFSRYLSACAALDGTDLPAHGLTLGHEIDDLPVDGAETAAQFVESHGLPSPRDWPRLLPTAAEPRKRAGRTGLRSLQSARATRSRRARALRT